MWKKKKRERLGTRPKKKKAPKATEGQDTYFKKKGILRAKTKKKKKKIQFSAVVLTLPILTV